MKSLVEGLQGQAAPLEDGDALNSGIPVDSAVDSAIFFLLSHARRSKTWAFQNLKTILAHEQPMRQPCWTSG